MITFCLIVFLTRSIGTFCKTWGKFGALPPGEWLGSFLVDIGFITVGCMALWQHLHVQVSIG